MCDGDGLLGRINAGFVSSAWLMPDVWILGCSRSAGPTFRAEPRQTTSPDYSSIRQRIHEPEITTPSDRVGNEPVSMKIRSVERIFTSINSADDMR